MFCVLFLWILVCEMMAVLSIPETIFTLQSATTKFKNSVQQQTFQDVLQAIEERLRNLDNIYSMQLSQTLKSKMELYHRKLDSLDTKIVRLESIIMLNLDNISENMSSKNYKDDVTRTQTYKQLENIYDGIARRIDYIDRKFELAMEKIQNKVDSTLQRLERMEEDQVQRNADIESDLSETLTILSEYRSSTSNTDLMLLNITNMLKETPQDYLQHQGNNCTIYKIVQEVNETLTSRFNSLENRTIDILNMSKKHNASIKALEIDLKEDFNAYANKVADMNMEAWKRNDILEENLKSMETVSDSIKTEVQNGLRALILHVGKLSGKDIMNNDKIPLESFKRNVNLSLEKIITNQELFLESCHRVQMDESQIESEISAMLGKLIDMLETKMKTVLRDLKSTEKTIKNHDTRVHRNLNQANINIISLFEKTTKAHDVAATELQDIKSYLNSLFMLMQDVLSKPNKTEDLLNELSVNVANLSRIINSCTTNTAEKWQQLESTLSLNNIVKDKFISNIINTTDVLLNNKLEMYTNITENMNRSLGQMEKAIVDLQKLFKTVNITNIQKNNNMTQYVENENIDINSNNTDEVTSQTIRNCDENNYGHLIDVRMGNTLCSNNSNYKTKTKLDENELKNTILNIFGTPPAPTSNVNEKINNINKNNNNEVTPQTIRNCDENNNNEHLIDVRMRNTLCSNNSNFKTKTELDENELKNTILEIFGTPPAPSSNANDKINKNVKKNMILSRINSNGDVSDDRQSGQYNDYDDVTESTTEITSITTKKSSDEEHNAVTSEI